MNGSLFFRRANEINDTKNVLSVMDRCQGSRWQGEEGRAEIIARLRQRSYNNRTTGLEKDRSDKLEN